MDKKILLVWLGAGTMVGCNDSVGTNVEVARRENAATTTNLMVNKTGATITIDGVATEWAGAESTTFSAGSNSVTVSMLWSTTNLYLLYKVTDTQINAAQTARDAANLYLDDTVELYIDRLNNGGSAMQTDDYQFLVNARNTQGDFQGTGSGKTATWNGVWTSAVSLQGTLNANGDTDTGYTVEIAIPWSTMTGGVPAVNTVMGIDLALDDSDSGGAYNTFDWAGLMSYGQPNLWKGIQLVDPPYAWWKADEGSGTTEADSSGNGITTTLVNGPTWPATSACKSGRCVAFDGTNDYGSATANLTDTNVVTVAFWLKWNAYAADDHLAMEFGAGATGFNGLTTGFMIDPNSSMTDPNTGLNVFEAGLKGNVGHNQVRIARPSAGIWHHYAFVFNKGAPAATEVTPYVDGLQVSYSKPTSSENTNNFGTDTLFQMARNGTTLFGGGSLDDVRIYKRALTLSEIQTLSGPPLVVGGLLDDGLSHPPPGTGTYAYNTFVPGSPIGSSYVDPVFGKTVRRVTNDNTVYDNIYGRNMWWNADGTRYLHQNKIINMLTNTVEYTGVPLGPPPAPPFEAGFDPLDPNVYYYFSGAELRKVVLGAGGSLTDSLYYTAPSALLTLGGSLNWIDASGRYMVLRYGADPTSVHVFDRLNLGAGAYTGAVDGTECSGSEYIGITADGNYLVGFIHGTIPSMPPKTGEVAISWKINHATRTIVSPTAPTKFWFLGGGHAAFISASDGRNYMLGSNSFETAAEMWRIDITNNATDGSGAPLSAAQEKALPNNARLLTMVPWNQEGDDCCGDHATAVARGALRDWGFISSEDFGDPFNGPVTGWFKYRQEIIAINVLSGEVRRLANHRSRGMSADYFYQPRISTSWAGDFIGWASNFNQSGVVNIYGIRLTSTP